MNCRCPACTWGWKGNATLTERGRAGHRYDWLWLVRWSAWQTFSGGVRNSTGGWS